MQKQRLKDLNVIMSDISAGKISAYLPPILRHACGVEVQRILHEVPLDQAHRRDSFVTGLVQRAKERAAKADLVIIPGGYDIKPEYYGQEPHPFTDKRGELCVRDEVESAMIKTALEHDKPILMICRGYQLGMVMMTPKKEINGMFSQHVPEKTRGVHRAEFYDGEESHFNVEYAAGGFVEDLLVGRKSPIINNKNVAHDVGIKPGTITHNLYKTVLGLPRDYDEEIVVSETSKHHQGIILGADHELPGGLKCSAISLAGDDVPIMEGFENPEKSMVVGMQWHPEANATGDIAKMFKTITDYATFKKLITMLVLWSGPP